MALRRTLSLRSLFNARFYQPSCSGIIRRDDLHEEKPNYGSLLHKRFFSSSMILSQKHLMRSSSDLSLCTPFGISTCRSMSTSHIPGSDESGDLNHVAATLTDSMLQDVSSQSTTVIKVADAAIDSSVHFDFVQQIIHNVHSFTGLNWWASIVLTTLLIRGVTVPLMIDNERWLSRWMMLEIHYTAMEEIMDQGGDPAALARHQMEFNKLVKENGGYNRLKIIFSSFQIVRFFLQFPLLICMGLTINNMTEKVASFKTGGALWFTDLTTADTSFIFPLLTGLTLWIAIECDALLGLEGILVTLKKLARFQVIPVLLMGMRYISIYMMSSMLFSIMFMYVIRRPGVKKYFGIPEVPEYMAIMFYRKRLKEYFPFKK
ncbi:hypothetical protein ISN44_As10g017260 [Arabidopsis suecica]|uniref:Mitochondrial inner membrane protein OXA1L n=1 Tax=Arabidopsis suecica TaxID=45249 RepID=A0A8T1ZXM4_ARASU|nr:hypothetical protein ISN44_As10g017260 [Arabidopsis suecica]